MAFTRKQVREMDEARLRQQVLVPLFRAMHFRDVFEYHGGTQEQGKDIVMWKPEDVRPRVNFGVVAKAARISGKATGKSSAAEVYFQVQQCLGEPFQDPRDSETRMVDRCWVVSNREIKKESLIALRSALKADGNDRLVDFINGDELWHLVEKYLPASATLDRLAQAREDLESVSKDYRILASTSAEGITLQLESKSGTVDKAEPIAFSAKLAFPDTSEGRIAQEQFQRHLTAGVPVEIDGAFVKDFQLPQFLKPYLNPTGEGVGKLVFGPRKLAQPVHARLIFRVSARPDVTVLGIEFRAIQVGSEELTLSNFHQAVPWHFEVRIQFAKRVVGLRCDLRASGLTVKRELELLGIADALALGAEFSVESEDTGLVLVGGRLPAGAMEPPDPGYMALLQKLMVIQEKLRVAIRVPDRPITEEEVKVIFETADKVGAGVVSGTMSEMVVAVDRRNASEALRQLRQAPAPPMTWSGIESVDIFGMTLVLGRAVGTVVGLGVTLEEVDRFQAELAADSGSETVDLRLTSIGEPARATVRYLQFIADSERMNLEAALVNAPKVTRDNPTN